MSIEELLIEFMPFFCVPIWLALFKTIIRVMINMAKGNIEIGERKTERKENINDLKEKINIDEDLQKYFNYKE